jgi:hypothetical protein
VDREKRDWRRDLDESIRENHKLSFEACKHFTTLDTAAALFVVAVFRETDAGMGAAVVPLLFFGISLVFCSFGLVGTALGGLPNMREMRQVSSLSAALICGALAFFMGLFFTVAIALRV